MKAAISTFVVVSQDSRFIDAVRTALGDAELVAVAADVAEAVQHMRSPSVSGLVVDAAALSAQPLPQLTRLRAAGPLVNILFVASELRGTLLNEVQPLRIEFVARPLPLTVLEKFVQRTRSAGRLSELSVGAWIAQLASAHKLSGSDVQLFSVVLDRETPEALCARLNIDEQALARGLRRLVKKCRVRNTDRLAKNLMRDALLLGTGQLAGAASSAAQLAIA